MGRTLNVTKEAYLPVPLKCPRCGLEAGTKELADMIFRYSKAKGKYVELCRQCEKAAIRERAIKKERQWKSILLAIVLQP